MLDAISTLWMLPFSGGFQGSVGYANTKHQTVKVVLMIEGVGIIQQTQKTSGPAFWVEGVSLFLLAIQGRELTTASLFAS